VAPEFAGVTVHWEPANAHQIEKALRLDAIRRVGMENYGCFEILYSLRNRAMKVRRGLGWIPVAVRESVGVGKLKGRLYSGIGSLDAIPGPIQAEIDRGVPKELAGLSVFAFNKRIRYLARSGLDMCEVDITNAFFNVLRLMLPALPARIVRYCDDRDNVLQSVLAFIEEQSGEKITRDDVKELFISIGFGGSVYGWLKRHLKEPPTLKGEWGDWIYGFKGDIASTRPLRR
jgi:hypothetical protein